MVKDSAEIQSFDPTFVARLEVARARGNLEMALQLVRQQFEGQPPEPVTIHSPVSMVYDTRLANTLEAMGIYMMLELGQTRAELLLAHPQIGPRMMERIIEGFEIHLGMRRRLKSAVAAEPQAESQKGETSR
jgi:DNA-directed RNA polymerase alpha subunit